MWCVGATILLLLGATTVLWRCFNAPPGSVGLEFPFDLIFYYIPMLQQATERMRAGDLPLWNPHQCCGVPFLATAQVGVFYPPTWLALVLPTTLAVQVLMFGQVFLAGLFAALFYRSLDRGWFASAIGGLLLIFTCVLGQIYWPSQVATLVWMPFLFWTAERFIQSRRWYWWLLFTFGVALQALAGFPQFMVYTFYLLGPYVLVRLICAARAQGAGQADAPTASSHRRWALATGGLLLAACVLATGLAAIQMVPTFELARNTARSGPLTEQAVHYLESERGRYLTLRGFFANMFNPRAKMITFDFPDGSGYLGTITPLLACLGLLFGWRDHRIRLFAVAVGVSFLLAFGYSDGSAWAYRIFARLPTGNMFRTPSRLLLITYFSAITLGVFGLDRVATGLRELRGRLWLRIAVVVLAVGLAMAAQSVSDDLGLRMAGAAVVLVCMAYLMGERPALLGTVRALILVVLVVDLAGATAPYGSLRDIPVEWGQWHHWGGVSPIRPEERDRAVRDAGLSRVALPGLRPTKVIEPPARYYAVTEYEPLLPDRWCWANRSMGGEPGFVMCMIDPVKYSGFYDMAGVTYLFRTQISDLARQRMGPHQWEIHHRVPGPAPAGMSSTLEHRTTALPRAYLVGRYELCPPEQALTRFMRADFDYQHAVLLEAPVDMPQAPAGTARQNVDVVSYAPERVVLRAEADGPRLLVLTDTYFPGWRATLDGLPIPILRANYLFRAVVLPPGRHEVIFAYAPRSFTAGASLTVLSALLILIFAWWMRRRVAHRDDVLLARA